MNQFDVIVIGSGPGGYVAAVRASQLGLKTALVEKDSVGGTCVNWGCIPTKALLRNAEVAHMLSQGKTYGFKCEGVIVDYAVAYNRSRQIAKRQGKRVELLLKSRNVTVIQGEARLVDANTVEIRPGQEQITAGSIILATGAKARQIPGVEFDGEYVITAREALELAKPPSSAVIIGAGAIGMEFATVWRRYGADVTIVEMLPHVLPAEDKDISLEAGVQYQKAGIKIKTGTKVESVVKTAVGVEVTVTTGEQTETLAAEKVLAAIGVAPDLSALGLDKANIALNGRGYIQVDDNMRTNIANIYAIGDITGKMALAHVASSQGMIAAEAIAGHKLVPLVYENIPRCTFGAVEVASAGLTELQARERGFDVVTVKSPFVPNGKALALNENMGFVKLIADKSTDKLLGAHMIGPHVTELIAGPAAMITLGATMAQLAQVVYAHPTLSEAVAEGIHVLAGHGIHL